MSEIAQRRVEEGSLITPEHVVHHLQNGFTPCSVNDVAMRTVPSEWPENHQWTCEDSWIEVNCDGCLKYKDHFFDRKPFVAIAI